MSRKFKNGDIVQHRWMREFILEVLDHRQASYFESSGEYILKDIRTKQPFSSSTSFVEANYELLSELGKILYK